MREERALLSIASGMTRREFVAMVGGAIIGALLPRPLPALGQSGKEMRVGLIVPARTVGAPLASAAYQTAGEAARMGALLAEAVAALRLRAAGYGFRLLLANAPSPDAARRAAERLIIGERATALVGGIGPDQAHVIAAIAERHDVPFLNIGSIDPRLRQEPPTTTFHIQASADMYLDALIGWNRSRGRRRWVIIAEDSPIGRRIKQRAGLFVRKHGGTVARDIDAEVGKPYYGDEFRAIRESMPDAVLLILDPRDELAFYTQFEFELRTLSEAPTVTALSNIVNTNRDFLAALATQAPNAARSERVTLWESTIATGEGGGLNERFMGRWGSPMESAAWAAYQAVQVLAEAVVGVRTTLGEALVEYLQQVREFSVAKGIAAWFSAGDRQLVQSLYLISVNTRASSGLRLSEQLGLASLVGELPQLYMPKEDARRSVSQLGKLP